MSNSDAYYKSRLLFKLTGNYMTGIDQTKTFILHYIMDSIIYVSTLKDNDTHSAGRCT